MELRKGMEGQFNIVVLRNNLKDEVSRLEWNIDYGVSIDQSQEDINDMKAKVVALNEVVETLEWYINPLPAPRRD